MLFEYGSSVGLGAAIEHLEGRLGSRQSCRIIIFLTVSGNSGLVLGFAFTSPPASQVCVWTFLVVCLLRALSVCICTRTHPFPCFVSCSWARARAPLRVRSLVGREPSVGEGPRSRAAATARNARVVATGLRDAAPVGRGAAREALLTCSLLALVRFRRSRHRPGGAKRVSTVVEVVIVLQS